MVSLMRKLARDRRASIPMVISLGNIELGEVESVPLNGGRIVSAALLRGSYSAVDSESTSLLILDTEISILDVLDTEEGASGAAGSEMMRRLAHRRATIDASARVLEREIVRARLAIALGSPDGQQYAPVVRARWMPNPFFAGGGAWSHAPAIRTIQASVPVDEGSAALISEWSQRLAALPESLWLGARRLVGAIADRIDALDAFVDAVVCWENLLGADAEVSFRLCAGLALILEPEDLTARAALYRELRELYNVRSGLVHGSREPSHHQAAEYRSRAIDVALKAVRAVFGRPDLLEAKDSNERNRRLLMGV